ncbi:hypothetical protein OXX69_001072 [Metschnikowia pulcherrima]
MLYTIVDGIATMNSTFDILVIGQRGIGKTTMLRKYVMGTHDEPSFESSECLVYKSVEMPCSCDSKASTDSNTNRQISILDSSAGVDTLLTQNSYQVKNAQTMVFAYSAASSESFESLEYTINCIESVRDKLPPCVIVSLKPDLGQTDQVSASQGEQLAKSCGALSFVETYLYDDCPVDDVFAPLVEVVLQNDLHKACEPISPNSASCAARKSKNSVSMRTSSSESETVPDNHSLTNDKQSLPTTPREAGSSQESDDNMFGDESSDPSIHQDLTEKCSDVDALAQQNQQSAVRNVHRSKSSSDGKSCKPKSGCCIIM